MKDYLFNSFFLFINICSSVFIFVELGRVYIFIVNYLRVCLINIFTSFGYLIVIK